MLLLLSIPLLQPAQLVQIISSFQILYLVNGPLERVTGFEPVSLAWKAKAQPLYHTRIVCLQPYAAAAVIITSSAILAIYRSNGSK